MYVATSFKTAFAFLDNKWDNIFDYNVDVVDGGCEDVFVRYVNLYFDIVEVSFCDAFNFIDKERVKVVNDLKA